MAIMQADYRNRRHVLNLILRSFSVCMKSRDLGIPYLQWNYGMLLGFHYEFSNFSLLNTQVFNIQKLYN